MSKEQKSVPFSTICQARVARFSGSPIGVCFMSGVILTLWVALYQQDPMRGVRYIRTEEDVQETAAELKRLAEEQRQLAAEQRKVEEEQRQLAAEQKHLIAEQKQVTAEQRQLTEEMKWTATPRQQVAAVKRPLVDYPIGRLNPDLRNIFFVETSCVFNNTPPDYKPPGGVVLSIRGACAVYSAAIMNPNHTVYLYHTCPLRTDYYTSSSEWLKKVLDLYNVFIVDVGREPEGWFRGTPLDGFGTQLSVSKWPVVHSSDALRYLLLWKYGGTYMDTDVIVLKSLDDLGVDWAVSASNNYVGITVFNFLKGSSLVAKMMDFVLSKYDPQGWISIGAEPITQVLREECNFPAEGEMVDGYGRLEGCGVALYPRATAFPRSKESFADLFNATAWEEVEADLRESTLVHLWNHLSRDTVPQEGSAFDRLSAAHCPDLYPH